MDAVIDITLPDSSRRLPCRAAAIARKSTATVASILDYALSKLLSSDFTLALARFLSKRMPTMARLTSTARIAALRQRLYCRRFADGVLIKAAPRSTMGEFLCLRLL